MKFTFDANILVYAFDEADHRRPAARALLQQAIGRDCILTVQSLGEFYVVATRKRKVAPDVALREVSRFRKVFQTIEADADCVEEAAKTSQWHRLQFWDAMLLATARRAGCSVVFSEDGHDGLNLNGVTLINPFLEKNRVLLDAALPPVD